MDDAFACFVVGEDVALVWGEGGDGFEHAAVLDVGAFVCHISML